MTPRPSSMNTRKNVTNAEIMSAVIEMQKQINAFTSADGWGGRVLLLETKNVANSKAITDLQHEISGNGQPGVKKDIVEVRTDLLEVKHNVKTMLAVTIWVLTPIFVILVGTIAGLIFEK